MKFSLFFCLISCFSCAIYDLFQYKSIKKITDGYGLIVLDLDKFEINDKIYITYGAYQGNISSFIYYTFNDTYPTNETIDLPEKLDSYAQGTTQHKHNISEHHGGYRYRVYYTYDHFYYYELEKKTNIKYLIMRYSFSPTSIRYLDVDNTKLSKNMKAILAVSITFGVILLVLAIFLFIKYRKKCCRGLKSSEINYNTKNNKDLPIPADSQILPPTTPMYVNDNMPNNVNYVQDNTPVISIYPTVNNTQDTYNYQNNNIAPINDCTYNSS